MSLLPLQSNRLKKAKLAYTPRNIALEKATSILFGKDITPSSGDLVLAIVEKIGQHTALELASGRRSSLFVGDEIIVCYGNRYAPDQFEAEVPNDLLSCDLVASGGLASRMKCRHASMKNPTKIHPIGLLADSKGKRINLFDSALPNIIANQIQRPYILAVVGTSMNAGKTTTAATLIRGLHNANYKVGAAKVTGTGSGRDTWLMMDAGSAVTLDFTHAGFPSTYLLTPEQITSVFTTLTSQLSKENLDVIVLEVADGLYQNETAALLDSDIFAQSVDSVIFAAGDAMGAASGAQWLTQKKLPLIAISGRLTASPLSIQETIRATGLSVVDKETLSSPAIANLLNIPRKKSDTQASSVVDWRLATMTCNY